jgi:dTMP kinase
VSDPRSARRSFVAFEGIDGSGKTTAARGLAALLRAEGLPALLVERGRVRAADRYADEQLRALSDRLWRASRDAPLDRLGELHWILLTASYYAALETTVIRPALDAGMIVVADGWFHKFALRVASNGARPLDEVLSYFRDVRCPDVVVLLDVPPETAAGRLGEFTTGEVGFHSHGTAAGDVAFVDYQRGIRAGLLELARIRGWRVLDGAALTSESVAPAVRGELWGWPETSGLGDPASAE